MYKACILSFYLCIRFIKQVFSYWVGVTFINAFLTEVPIIQKLLQEPLQKPLQSKSMDWFLYDRDHLHERVMEKF